MYISKVHIKNFRLLKDTTIDLQRDLSILVGKNNTGKTSLLVLFDKFINGGARSFSYDDFHLSLREHLDSFNASRATEELSIRLVIEINYDSADKLNNLSEFILDLDPEHNVVKLLFECRINGDTFNEALSNLSEDNTKKKYISARLTNHLEVGTYVYDDKGWDGATDYITNNREKLISKELGDIKKLLNIQIIHARRQVSSSEDSGRQRPLSILTSEYYKQANEIDSTQLSEINKTLLAMDAKLDKQYEDYFKPFVNASQDFLGIGNLNVFSDIHSKIDSIIENSSRVLYGSSGQHLPENLNGLGYLNILYLLLTIEIKKKEFETRGRDINLLFIEEPEAHTHPQMQYIFARKIKSALSEVKSLQTLITTHSSHIISESNLEDIRYLSLNEGEVKIKNFQTELEPLYTDNKLFDFVKKYLNIHSSELFFADKAIFIEGITERMLLPYFIDVVDTGQKSENKEYIPISSQNVTIMEVGANAKAFAPLLKFLNIKALIITDIDTVKATLNEDGKTSYTVCPVSDGATHTSNATLKHFLNAPDIQDVKAHKEWFEKLLKNEHATDSNDPKITYQLKEGEHHARSFEEAFIAINIDLLKSKIDNINGIKNESHLEAADTNTGFYELTDKIIDKKSDFAASLIYLALTGDAEWKTPSYIAEGLKWIGSSDTH